MNATVPGTVEGNLDGEVFMVAKALPRWQVGTILGLGVLAVATSSVIIRLALNAAQTEGFGFSLVLAVVRLLLATAVLLPTGRSLLSQTLPRRAWGFAIAAGFCLAGHFATWITSLSFTSIAASTALVTTNPVWVGLILWLWFGQRPSRLTMVGIAIALTGGMIIAFAGSGGIHGGSNPLLGDGLALLGAMLASLYFLLGREAQRQGMGLGAYGAIAYGVAALVLLPLPPLLGVSYLGYPPIVYGCMVAMALIPQLIGHTVINWSVMQISPTLVTLAILFEPVAASVMGWIGFGEVPGWPVVGGGLILLMGVALAVVGEPRQRV
ncbi:DMT family transporter [Spirulina sp. CCNP1310]|uniref:DMT family transporter n=1 Tax=Spirulina sp. CCNP1310 TaxID=3110249 RepID=UPI002B2037F8|nr:DMT family transporter [Spirulina sp. CCNP1310]